MEIANYLISAKGKARYVSLYTSLFKKDMWYPDDFFPKNFTVFYYVFPYIVVNDKPQKRHDFLVTGTTLLTKRGEQSYLDWGKFVGSCIQSFRDTELFFRAADFTADFEENIYSIGEEDYEFFLAGNNLKIFNDEINGHSMDDGSVLLGNSGKWFYYSGEVFYRKAIEEDQYLEFDAFAVEDSHVSTFASYLKESIKEKFKISDRINPDRFFQEVVHPDRSLYEIKLQI